ncbi:MULTISPECIES: hypothetical protein [Rhodomicrobium]|uniref:hypothetical protein n=1 Tax=Rhodomicrobium TaxID=1068 RepID=UPI001FD8A856|nr:MULTISPECIES: hypothetical protein [Rhodomicrobium]
MQGQTILKRCLHAMAATMTILAAPGSATAETLPDFMEPIAGLTQSSPEETATKNVLALNTVMFELYGDAAKVFRANILAKHPVILALFSGAGGRFILYRPGQPPLDAPPVPIAYQLLKSVGHATMALTQVVGPYLDNPDNQSWRASMLAYRSRMQSALDGLGLTDMPEDWRENNRVILQNNIAFMDAALDQGVVSFAELADFSRHQAPFLKLNVAWAAQTQVAHWMGVLTDWKAMLGPDWDKTYAASNTIYVARQNNVLFSVLAQFFGPEAINSRLMLIETVSFTTTPEDMLDSLTRIIADRSVGSLFFGNYHLMDYELMGGDARAAIQAESDKRGTKAFLPPAVPFGSNQWPTLVTPGPGPTSISELP